MIFFRAFHLQILPQERLESLQNKQFQTVIHVPARRGAIVDRFNRDLALSTSAYSLYADPKIIENRKKVAKLLSKELNLSYASIYSKLKDTSKRFVWIQRKLDQSKMEIIRSWDVRGLSFIEEWRRVYPNDSLLSQTLGFLGSDGQGLEGIERQYDSQLKGRSKVVTVRRDARGRPLVTDELLFSENQEGAEIQLTIDSELQYSLETELKQSVREFQALSAMGIILDAETSEILAMATAPTFDINQAMKVPASIRRNKIVADVFEPGSTLKTFVLASGIKEKLFTPQTKIFCENGQWMVGKHLIKEAESKEKFGNLTIAEILAVSSNVGTSKVALKMGDELVEKSLKNFGFGMKLGVDLPGEARGLFQGLPWHQHLLANISFGHGIATTPLQIANAYASIANGGQLNIPYIVKSIKNMQTGEIEEKKPQLLRRVLPEEVAQQMRKMLVKVTEDEGTGINARVNGFTVGGKTGTAQKVDPQGRGYLKGAYISSFAGFIPADKPRFVIYVAIDSPQKNYYGSTVAAPIFSRIASFAARKGGIAPPSLSSNTAHGKIHLPTKEKKRSLASAGFDEKRSLASTSLKKSEMGSGGLSSTAIVPELMQLSLREVLRKTSGTSLRLKIIGQGVVSDMSPAPGSPLTNDQEITIILK